MGVIQPTNQRWVNTTLTCNVKIYYILKFIHLPQVKSKKWKWTCDLSPRKSLHEDEPYVLAMHACGSQHGGVRSKLYYSWPPSLVQMVQTRRGVTVYHRNDSIQNLQLASVAQTYLDKPSVSQNFIKRNQCMPGHCSLDFRKQLWTNQCLFS